MIDLMQGSGIDEVEAYAESLKSNKKILAFYKRYRSRTKIISNQLKKFLKNGDLHDLLQHRFMQKYFRTEKVIVTISSDPEQFRTVVIRLVDKLDCLRSTVKVLKKEHSYYQKIKHNPYFVNDDADERTYFNGPFAKLKNTFENAKKKGLLDYDGDDDLNGHFRCTDSSPRYDKEKYRFHRFRWLGSDNEFSVFVNEFAENGFSTSSSKINYIQYGKHFVNSRGEHFRDLPKKFKNTESLKTDYPHIRDLFREAQ